MQEYIKPEELEVIVYHSPCLDGVAAAFVAHQKAGRGLTFVPYDPNHPPEDKLTKFADTVIGFFDSAPSVDLLSKLRGQGNRVIVIDHHVGNKRALEGQSGCFFDMERSGCQLAWRYFNENEPIPELLRIIGDRDLGNFAGQKNLYVGYALMERKLDTLDAFIAFVDSGVTIDDLIAEGREVEKKVDELKAELKPQQTTVDDKVVTYARVRGYKFISELAQHLLKETHPDFVVLYYAEKGGYKLSLRTEKPHIDVAVIAASLGRGGGHAKAAGAFVTKLPWGIEE
jgi:oligoribonuclease NrnB/cAMP/cGMP phosphodiesterase (DHH superfamily)